MIPPFVLYSFSLLVLLKKYWIGLVIYQFMQGLEIKCLLVPDKYLTKSQNFVDSRFSKTLVIVKSRG